MSRSTITARQRRASSAERTTTVSRRTKAAAVAAATALSLGALGVWATSAGAAAAAVPVFPDNIVAFPDRDFVSVEGYEEYAGQEATLEVFRPGVGTVGAAKAIVAAGGVAFEVNHPGGSCWGAGFAPLMQVTPDLIPGDEVTVSIGGIALDTTTIQDLHASNSVLQADGVTMLVAGRIAGLDPAQMEQRVIEPALVDTAVGKRDVRAVLGGFQPGPNGAYQSKLEVDVASNTFLATYLFDDPAVAAIAAAATGERAMGWQLVDSNANRQGLTIAEFGEAGGPGVGGCPNGPLQNGPPGPTNTTAARVPGATSITVNWTPALAIPGGQPILGYRVWAVDTTSVNGEQVEIGRRIGNPAAIGTTITGLDPLREYTVVIASVSSVGETFPAVPALVVHDTVAPVITASPAGGSYAVAQSVTLTANEPGVDMWYTTDGSDPIDANTASSTATAIHYTGPISVAASGTVTYGGFDPSSNASAIATESYVITNQPTAAKTDILTAVPALQSVILTWAAADPVSPATAISGYEVKVYDSSSGSAVAVATVPFPGAGTSGTVTGLTGNQQYWFTVAAINDINPAPGPESNRVGPITALGPVVADAGPDQANVVRNTTVQLNGSASTTGATITYQWVQLATAQGVEVMAPGPNLRTIANPTAASTTFLLPSYTFGQSSGPLYFQLTVTDTSTGEIKSDRVTITPRNDVVTVASARWKQNDFRVTGTGAIEGAIITVRWTVSNVTSSATTTVVAGAWDLRLRNGAAPANPGPATVTVTSNQGGTFGPFNVVR